MSVNPEPVSREFIELYNPGDATIDLKGYQFASGIKFTFPAVTLAPGGYLIVSPDKDAFRANYRTNAEVLGNWTGRLSNSSEEIRLEDAEGKTVDRVLYADQGDWARRINGDGGAQPPKRRSMFSNRRSSRNTVGWIWKCDADGDARLSS